MDKQTYTGTDRQTPETFANCADVQELTGTTCEVYINKHMHTQIQQ